MMVVNTIRRKLRRTRTLEETSTGDSEWSTSRSPQRTEIGQGQIKGQDQDQSSDQNKYQGRGLLKSMSVEGNSAPYYPQSLKTNPLDDGKQNYVMGNNSSGFISSTPPGRILYNPRLEENQVQRSRLSEINGVAKDFAPVKTFDAMNDRNAGTSEWNRLPATMDRVSHQNRTTNVRKHNSFSDSRTSTTESLVSGSNLKPIYESSDQRQEHSGERNVVPKNSAPLPDGGGVTNNTNFGAGIEKRNSDFNISYNRAETKKIKPYEEQNVTVPAAYKQQQQQQQNQAAAYQQQQQLNQQQLQIQQWRQQQTAGFRGRSTLGSEGDARTYSEIVHPSSVRSPEVDSAYSTYNTLTSSSLEQYRQYFNAHPMNGNVKMNGADDTMNPSPLPDGNNASWNNVIAGNKRADSSRGLNYADDNVTPGNKPSSSRGLNYVDEWQCNGSDGYRHHGEEEGMGASDEVFQVEKSGMGRFGSDNRLAVTRKMSIDEQTRQIGSTNSAFRPVRGASSLVHLPTPCKPPRSVPRTRPPQDSNNYSPSTAHVRSVSGSDATSSPQTNKMSAGNHVTTPKDSVTTNQFSTLRSPHSNTSGQREGLLMTSSASASTEMKNLKRNYQSLQQQYMISSLQRDQKVQQQNQEQIQQQQQQQQPYQNQQQQQPYQQMQNQNQQRSNNLGREFENINGNSDLFTSNTLTPKTNRTNNNVKLTDYSPSPKAKSNLNHQLNSQHETKGSNGSVNENGSHQIVRQQFSSSNYQISPQNPITRYGRSGSVPAIESRMVANHSSGGKYTSGNSNQLRDSDSYRKNSNPAVHVNGNVINSAAINHKTDGRNEEPVRNNVQKERKTETSSIYSPDDSSKRFKTIDSTTSFSGWSTSNSNSKNNFFSLSRANHTSVPNHAGISSSKSAESFNNVNNNAFNFSQDSWDNNRNGVFDHRPSPCDSGMEDMGYLLQEKEKELKTLRDTMARNEQAILQVLEDKKKYWEQDLMERNKEWQKEMEIQYEKSMRRELSLQYSIVKLQQENKVLRANVESLTQERTSLVENGVETESELCRLRKQVEMLMNETTKKQNEIVALVSSFTNFRLDDSAMNTLDKHSISGSTKTLTDYTGNEIGRIMEDKVSSASKINGHGGSSVDINGHHTASRYNGNLHEYPTNRGINNNSKISNGDLSPNYNHSSSDSRSICSNDSMNVAAAENLTALQIRFKELEQELKNCREGFQIEEQRWLEEKDKVINYQKQLQTNYLQVLQKNQALEGEIEQLKRASVCPSVNSTRNSALKLDCISSKTVQQESLC